VVTDRETRVAWMLKRLVPFSLYSRILLNQTKRMMGKKRKDLANE